MQRESSLRSLPRDSVCLAGPPLLGRDLEGKGEMCKEKNFPSVHLLAMAKLLARLGLSSKQETGDPPSFAPMEAFYKKKKGHRGYFGNDRQISSAGKR